MLEFARNVLGIDDAQHAEYDPTASSLFVTPLSCSLAARQFTVELVAGTTAARAYGRGTATELYYCNFGINPDRRVELESSGLVSSGVDRDHNSEARIVELLGHRFFVGTLFVPQMTSTPGRPHPLVVAFLQAAARAVSVSQP